MRTSYPANAYYGFEKVVRTHAHWPLSVKALIPHGVLLNPYHVHREIRDWAFPLLLTYSWLTSGLGRVCEKDSAHSASPFVYLVDHLEPVPVAKRRSRRGSKLLYFPAHSTARITAAETPSGALDRLEGLRSEGFEVTVNLYWRDMELGRGEWFERHGYATSSFGHREDPRFIDRLVEGILANDALVGDGFGSHMFYGAYLGRPYFCLTPQWEGTNPRALLARYRQRPSPSEIKVYDRLPPDVEGCYLAMIEAFGTLHPHTNPTLQLELAAEFMGRQNLLTKEELRSLLVRAELADVMQLSRPHGAPLSPKLARARASSIRLARRLRDKAGRLLRSPGSRDW